jgi:hypothetical protein
MSDSFLSLPTPHCNTYATTSNNINNNTNYNNYNIAITATTTGQEASRSALPIWLPPPAHLPLDPLPTNRSGHFCCLDLHTLSVKLFELASF